MVRSLKLSSDAFVLHFHKLVNFLNLEVKKKEIYRTSFVHTSYANENKCENNERLEFLGDAILDYLVAEYLYMKYPTMPEGEMSKTKAIYVCEKANSEYALSLGLDQCLLLGKGETEQGGKAKPSVLGDLFEAFLGAVYLDSGIKKVKDILEKFVFPNISYTSKGFFEDFKSMLQEYIQAESRLGVAYTLDKEIGPSHDKTFTISVYHEGIRLGTGIGKSKKEAEQNAAKDAIDKLVKQ